MRNQKGGLEKKIQNGGSELGSESRLFVIS